MNAYLDNSATTRPSEAVAASVRELMEGGWYNPSALYKPALEIQKRIYGVRETCLQAAGAAGQRADLLALLVLHQDLDRARARFLLDLIQ